MDAQDTASQRGAKRSSQDLQAELDEQKHLNEVMHAFSEYQVDMMMEVSRRERNVRQCKPLVERLPGGESGLVKLLNDLRDTVRSNQSLFDRMLVCNKFTTAGATGSGPHPVHPDLSTEIRNLSKVRSTLHQCAREWSEEGREEREKTFAPLLDYLRRYVPPGPERKVLVPGCGLGRLPAEIVGQGYSCQGNEFSYQMLLMCEFLLNELTSSEPAEQAVIHPWIHNPSNVLATEDMLRPVRIPDVSASELVSRSRARNVASDGSDEAPPAPEMSMCAGEFVEIYSKQPGAWDAVVTCFFIDTAPNVYEYIKVIHAALKPGGVWINGGPLLWHWQSNGPKGGASSVSESDRRYSESIELSWDQVRSIVQNSGFAIKEERTQEDVGYTSNPRCMMKSVYTIVQFVAVRL